METLKPTFRLPAPRATAVATRRVPPAPLMITVRCTHCESARHKSAPFCPICGTTNFLWLLKLLVGLFLLIHSCVVILHVFGPPGTTPTRAAREPISPSIRPPLR